MLALSANCKCAFFFLNRSTRDTVLKLFTSCYTVNPTKLDASRKFPGGGTKLSHKKPPFHPGYAPECNTDAHRRTSQPHHDKHDLIQQRRKFPGGGTKLSPKKPPFHPGYAPECNTDAHRRTSQPHHDKHDLIQQRRTVKLRNPESRKMRNFYHCFIRYECYQILLWFI